MESLTDVTALSSLLSQSKEANEARADQFHQKPTETAPTLVKGNRNVIENNSSGSGLNEANNNSKPTSANKSNIWEEQEIPSEDALLVKDDRPSPKYEISYKQSIGTEDTFLGMSDKTPLTSDCTHLIIKVHFPGATMKQLDLNVTRQRIIASSKFHRLFTYFPVKVDENNGKAQFDSKKEVLTVTLPILPDY